MIGDLPGSRNSQVDNAAHSGVFLPRQQEPIRRRGYGNHKWLRTSASRHVPSAMGSEAARGDPALGVAEHTCFPRKEGVILKKSKRSHASRQAQQHLPQFRMKPLAVVIAMYCSGAMAADPAAGPNDALEEITVTGLRQSLVNSMTIKRDSLGIVDAILPEDIGKLPDTNLAESLQRIPCVSIDRSGGEGAFVTVRGFGPEFNTVLVNGRQIATPTDPSHASGRAFSFDTLASELISGVEVHKSATARLQSGGVGSTIDIKTARPFNYSGFKFSGSADANYEENSKKASPDAAFLISDRFADGRF